MLLTITLVLPVVSPTLVAAPIAAPIAALPPDPPLATPDPGTAPSSDEEYDKRLDAAGKDVEKLWALYEWCEATERTKEGKSVLRKIVRYDEHHRKAREALGHLEYDGEWFTSEKKLAAHKKKKLESEAKAKGWVKHKGEWVDPRHIPFLEKGLVQDATGRWITEEERDRLAKGWVRQDLAWVSPDEIGNIEQGLWKCGEEWLSESDADKYHAQLGTWWQIPSEHFVLWTTSTRKQAMRTIDELDIACRDLTRVLGSLPIEPVPLVILRDPEQFAMFARGTDEGHPPTEVRGFSSIHYAFFAESWTDDENQYLGMGAGYWDANDETRDKFGRHAARHALALSVMDALDPSAKSIEALTKRKGGAEPGESWVSDFWEEKEIPTWFRYGVAAYVERYFPDSTVKRGGNSWWTREWSISNIKNRGGLDSLGQIFDMRLEASSKQASDDSAKKINQAGLLIAFAVDGECEPVKEALVDVQLALTARNAVTKSIGKLQKAIEKHEDELEAFAGL